MAASAAGAAVAAGIAARAAACCAFAFTASAAPEPVDFANPFTGTDNTFQISNGNIYPYYRFDTYAVTPVSQTWKMVVLENDFLRVKIFPEIGGKVWSVYDKTSGTELFYDNDAVKFRDIALRGPWTSGGIEFNYGIIGHAPS